MLTHPILKALLTCFFGFILSLSAPGYNFWFLAWVGLVPLFIIINTSRKIREVIFYSFLFGLSYNLWYLHWLFSLYPLDWLGFNSFQSYLISFLALFIVAAYNVLFFILFGISAFYISIISPSKGIKSLSLTTFLWLIIFNKLSSFKFLFGFPWTLIEYSQYKNLFLIQIAEYFGSISIGFLIVFFNLVLANIFIWLWNIEKIGNRYISREPGKFIEIVTSFSFILILVSLSTIFGTFLYEKNIQYFSNNSQSICILQGNLPIKATRGGHLDITLARKTYNDLINKNNAVLFIAPEGALPTIYNSDTVVQSWLKNTAKEKMSDFIFGSYCKQKEKLTNCTIGFSPLVNKIPIYEKERLVPFGEFTPFSFILPRFLKTLAKSTIGEGFSEGKQNLLTDTSIGKAGINICFELIFPEIIRKHALKGANFLVNFSDLSWFSNDQIKQQFLSFGVFRAIENRKPVIIANNNGISAFIESSGKIKSQSLPNTQGVLIDWINPNNKITAYAKYGW